MDVHCCLILKDEERYLDEWLYYYNNLGFDHFMIFDDNDKDNPISTKYLEKLKQENKVSINRTYDIIYPQIKVYKEYYEIGNFNWCLFVDIDEFLDLKEYTDIHEFLNDFLNKHKEAEEIIFPWLSYGDNGLYKEINLPVLERFKDPCKFQGSKVNSNLIEGKCLIKKGINGIINSNPHNFYKDSKDEVIFYLSNGEKIENVSLYIRAPFTKNYTNAPYLKHFRTKSTEEFMKRCIRGNADSEMKRNINEYWMYNEKTPERIKWFNYYKELYHIN